MEKLPSPTGPGATPDVLAPAVPGVNPNQLALPAAPTIDLPPSAVTEAAPTAARAPVHFEVTTLPPVEGTPADATVGQSEVVAPVDAWAAAMPAAEAVPPQPGRAEKVRNAARNAGRFATVAMEAAGALDRTGIPDALIASGIGGRTGTVVRGAAKATKTAAKLNNARHQVEAALQPSPTGEGRNNEVIDPQASLSTGGNSGNTERPAPEPAPRTTTGAASGRASVPPSARYGASTGRGPEMPAAFGTFNATQEGGDVPRHAALDPFLGLSREQFAHLASTPEGRVALQGRAAQMQAAQSARIRADRPVSGHRDPRTGEEIPYYGPAQGPLVTGGKILPAVDRSRPAIYGEPGAGWNPDPRVETARSASSRHAHNEDARSLEITDPQPHGLTVPERVRGALRRAFRGRAARREEANLDAAREAGFDEQERRGAQYRGALSPDDVAAKAKGYVDVESSDKPLTEKPKSTDSGPRYSRLKFRN